jgi:serine/threonine-protein kinase
MPRTIGRYALYNEIASGGMASVHLGRLIGPVGFARTVAIKRLHPHLASNEDFVTMFVDEARLAARIQHPNVVAMLDVVLLPPELFLVMEYVHGESLSRLARAARKRREAIPVRVASAVMIATLHGLHAAHEAKNERGEPMHLVHRDVSPQNVLVGVDGVARIADFGVAKASGRLQSTTDGQLKGKAAYLSPEQVAGDTLDRRTDVYAASVVLWELLAGRRLFHADNALATMRLVMEQKVEPPSQHAPSLPEGLDAVVLRGLASDPEARFSSTREMAIALEEVVAPATAREVGDWVQAVAADELDSRASRVAEIESASLTEDPEGLESLRGNRDKPPRDQMPTVREGTPPQGVGVEPSSVSLESPGGLATEGKARRPRRMLLLLAAGLAVAGLATYGLVSESARRSGPAPAARSAVPAPGSVALPSAERPAASGAASAEKPAGSAAPAASASAAEPKPAPKPVAVHRYRPRAKPRARPTVKKPNCSNPFTYTSDGRKIPRPECF